MCAPMAKQTKIWAVLPKKGSLVFIIYLEGEISNKPQTWFSIALMLFISFGRKSGFMEALLGNAPPRQMALHKPTCTHHTGPTLWVTGFNIQLPRPYPKPSESHLGRTRWFYARMQPEAESWCGWLSVPAATAVFLLLLPLTLPWAW